MKKRLLVVLLSCLLLLTSCKTVSRQDMLLEDYDYFWNTIDENYALYPAAERITGTDLPAVREQYREAVALGDDVNALADALTQCARAFGGAGHLSVLTDPDSYQKMCLLYGQFQENSPIAGFLYDRLNNPTSVRCYGFDPNAALDEIEESGGTQPGTQSNGNLSFQDYPRQKAAYVSIQKMTNYWDNNDFEVLEQWFAELEAQGYQHCIVDIRGNGGGNSDYWKNYLVAPNLSQPLTVTQYGLIKGALCREYLERFAEREVHPIQTLPLEELPALASTDLEGIDSYWKSTGVWEPQGTPLFSGRFWLLVDSKVYSSSEGFASFCKSTGFATLVGTNTGGDTPGSDPLVFVLPNSGLVFRLSPGNTLNPDGSCNEELGTAPDLLIDSTQDALEVCLQAIEDK